MSKRLLFLGSDKISEICLKTLLTKFPDFDLTLITTSNKSPPALLAAENGLRFLYESKGKMQDWKIMNPQSEIWTKRFDFLVSASFGYLIPKNLIEHSDGTLNLHPSMLPKYRGSSPIQHALYNQDETTGVSIITIHPEKFDKGRILKQQLLETSILEETYASLSVKLAELGSSLLCDVLSNYPGHLASSMVQDENKATNALKLENNFSKLELTRTSELYARFRSIYGTSMHPYLNFQGMRVNILKMTKVNDLERKVLNQKYPAAVEGSIWLIYPDINKRILETKFLKNINKVLYVKTGDDWIIVSDFLVATMPNKRNNFSDFINNYLDLNAYAEGRDMTKESGSMIRFE